MLDDGTYDAVVVDAANVGDSAGTDALRLEMTIVAGDRKGDVVSITATGLGRGEVDVMGLPATIEVSGGEPRVTFD